MEKGGKIFKNLHRGPPTNSVAKRSNTTDKERGSLFLEV